MNDSAETGADHRRHELLSDVAEAVAQFVIDKKIMEPDPAMELGNHLADFLADHWKGQKIYMVGDRDFKLNKRDLEIYQRMQRGNANELAAEYNISYVRVYQIYKRCLAEARSRRQNDLFGDTTQHAAPTE
ncbi:Transcriptional regulator, Middle operon regulator (Mor) family [Rhodoferax sp. OV413]|uniref:Mor transcription activator family protein n=1 Tax=Rhodoferax sp. OV413 TaxID=1855285 RepID=UPI00088CFA07|nr:Mor transcription activator family protein [Rhodoferax sp. OV413]SDO77829.1 Transcriptional regulator, Middle operon regulator (Mor) family [Rhodoferax sp. OV413]